VSAKRDHSQKVVFLYSNLYRVYKGKESAPVVVQQGPKTPTESLKANLKRLSTMHGQLQELLKELQELCRD